MSVATLVAADTDTVAADLEWSIASGADQSHFTLSDAGELSFAAAKDFENPDDSGPDGVYEVSVSVSDGVDSDTAALSVTVTNVVELTTLTGPVDVEHSENWAGRVATYSASSGADAGELAWSLSGDDAARFSIDDPGGALRFSIQPTGDDLFLELPDFDNPVDNDGDGTYEITVHAEGGGDQQTLDVEVTVTDAPEPGTLALSSTRPQLGETLTATLTDPDADTGAATYVWERSVGRGTWATLANTAASHVPTAADTGHFLRVTATYQDGHGSGNTAAARTSEVVTADRLTALTVSTTDSAANSGHALRPSFDAGILHYSIGCAATDTMTLTPTAGSGVRISINGTQVTSGESRTAAVDADSEVRVTLAAASGAATTYFVRCLSGNLLDMTATTASGATGVIEDLIMFGVEKESERSIAIVDSNGAVRFHDMDANWGGGYFRAAWVSAAGEYRYSYRRRGGGQHWQVLDQNLEFIANVGTVAPLTDTNQHDFALLDDGNYLLMAYEPVERDLSELTFGTFGTSVRMRDAALQIRTPGGTPLLTWSSHDAIPFEDCSPKFPPEQADYAHVNTLQMVDGDIVASFRGCNTVLRIDPDDASSHKVVWRVGLTNLSDEQWDGLGKGPAPLAIIGDAEGQFCGQHGSSLLPNGHLILFDNGALCMDDPWLDTQLLARPGGEFSRALEYALDVDNGEAVFLRDHSLGGARAKTARVHGHVEKLPNGDWLIGWGEAGPRPATVSVTQADPNTGEEKFWIRLLQANGSSESIRPTLLPPVALADVLPPLEARIVTGAHTSTDHHGAADRPTVAVAFNRPVADFAATSSVSVAGGSVEGVAALVESGAPAHAYVFTLVPDGDADIGFSLLAGKGCDTDPAGVCTAEGTMLSVVAAAPHTIGYAASNSAPEFDTAETGARSVAENTAAGQDIGAAVAATDDDLDTLSYSIAGADSAAFDVDAGSGQLSTLAPLDHEAKDSYRFTLSVSDGKDADGITDGAIDDTVDVAVTVTDVNEAPVVSGSAAVSYDEGGTGVAARYTATDPDDDDILWSVAGIDSDDFEIDSSGTLTFKASPDFEDPSDSDADSVYLVTVNASDGPPATGPLTATVSVTVTVDNIEEAGTLALSSSHPLVGTAFVATLDDPDGAIANRSWSWQRSQDKVSWSAVSGADTGSYTPSVPDVGRFLRVSVTYDDGEGAAKSAEQTSIEATRAAPVINHAPLFAEDSTDRSVAEDSPVRTLVGAPVTAVDEDLDTLSYSIAGADAAGFDVDAGSGQLSTLAPLDHEAKDSYRFTLSVSDGKDANGITDGAIDDTVDVAVTVTDVNEAPVASGSAAVSYDEGGTGVVARYTATDPDDDDILWSVAGIDSDDFEIDSSGTLTFKASPDFEGPSDSDADSVYLVTVNASDGPLTATVSVSVTVDNIEEAGTLALSSSHPLVGTAFVATLDDPDGAIANRSWSWQRSQDKVSWSAVSGADTGSYTPSEPDVGRFLRVRVTYDDGEGAAKSAEQTSIEATRAAPVINHAPLFAEDSTDRSVAEDSPVRTLVGAPVTAVDEDLDTLSYSIAGADAAAFDVDAGSGQLSTLAPLDHEAKDSYRFTLSVSDGKDANGITDSAIDDTVDVAVTVTDVNEAPVVSGSAAVSYDEGGTGVVARYTATDPDDDDILWSVAGIDSDDFEIDSSANLTFKTPPDFEGPSDSDADSVYLVTVNASDGLLTATVSVSVTVDNIEEAGTLGLSSSHPLVGTAFVATLDDPDGAIANRSWSWQRSQDKVSWSAVSGADTGSYTPEVPDVGRFLRVRVTYDDGEGAAKSAEQTSIEATRAAPVINHAPLFAEDSTDRSVAEDSPVRTLVGAPVTAVDEDLDTLSYSIAGADAAAFDVDAGSGQLSTLAPLDHEAKDSYRFTLSVSDGKDADGIADAAIDDTVDVAVTVTDVNEAPVVSGPQSLSLAENQATDRVLAVFGAVDPEDPSGLVTRWSLSGTDAGDFSVSEAGELLFRKAPDFERPADSNRDNVYGLSVRASDGRSYGYLAVTVTVTDVDEAPEIATAAKTALVYRENGTAVLATFRAVDPEEAVVVWSLSGPDGGHFAIYEGMLTFKRLRDFESPADADRRQRL